MATINRNAAQEMVTILSNKRVGAYHQILLNVGDIVKNCRPGNFVAISVGGDTSKMILRRAFAISRVSESSQYGGTMELIVAPHGSGSKWLCSQLEGAEIDIVAPLGTAFGIPTEPISALLIGGGYGSAPLFGLADVLKSRGCKVDMLLGASVGLKIYAPMEGKRSVNSLKIYTETGPMILIFPFHLSKATRASGTSRIVISASFFSMAGAISFNLPLKATMLAPVSESL